MKSPYDQGRVEGAVWAWFNDGPVEDESVCRQWMADASQPHSGMSHREPWKKVFQWKESQVLQLAVHHEEEQMD